MTITTCRNLNISSIPLIPLIPPPTFLPFTCYPSHLTFISCTNFIITLTMDIKDYPTRPKNHQEFHQTITIYTVYTIYHTPSHLISSPIKHPPSLLIFPTFQPPPLSPINIPFILSTTDFSTVFVFVSVLIFLYYSHPLHLSPFLTHVSNCNFSS